MSEYKVQKITDTQKFAVMTEKYNNLYKGYLEFSNKIGVSKSSVNEWERRIERKIGHKSKTQICKVFNLNYKVWTDEFFDEKTFRETLYTYKEITDDILKTRLDTKMVGKKAILVGNEEDELEELKNQSSIKIDYNKLHAKSQLFSFELIPLLIENNQIEDSFKIIDFLQNSNSTFALYYYNQIEYYKAIIYSHSKVRKWDEAIEILRFLYSVSNYHLQKPELITLMASNYKRKALTIDADYDWCNKENIDLDLISNAIVLYNEAYKYKTYDQKYYDAINLAYLYKLLDSFDGNTEIKNNYSIKNLYNDLTLKWKYNRNDWWETSTKAEFLTLLGNTKEAIFEIEHYLEQNKVKKFDIETTLRQVSMCIHFCNDYYVQQFHTFLKESWKDM